MPQRKRWNYFKDRLIEDFGELVYKIGVDAGFDCPNRDGNKAFGGCAYCSQEGSLSPHQNPKLAISEQIKKGISFNKRRYGAEKNIVYFQSFTNTYDKISVLKERYDSGLIDESIIGMSIATRPDCVNQEIADFLAAYKEEKKLKYFTLELGLQSAHQNKLEWVNRQETIEDYVKCMEILNKNKIDVISHIILGFPGETKKEMSDTVKLAEECNSYGVKLQMLHVIVKTKLEFLYKKEMFELMDFDEYCDLLIYLVERLDRKVQIHRITGETEKSKLVAPLWVQHKTKVFSRFDQLLEQRDTYQGRLNWEGQERN